MTALTQSLSTSLNDFINSITEIAEALPLALAAARDYDRMADLTDAQLERRGLSREELPGYVYDRHFS
ncbi:MAG: hypothetical protein AAGI13_07490 [Pseudomonadota bacterium]